MIVKFKDAFHVPGFGRTRFPKGIVRDVPEQLRDMLPSSAKILPDDTPTEEEQAEVDDLRAADLARAASSATDQEALVASGHAGWEDEKPEPELKPVEEKKLPRKRKGKKR